jgi:hypothetical protein
MILEVFQSAMGETAGALLLWLNVFYHGLARRVDYSLDSASRESISASTIQSEKSRTNQSCAALCPK